MTMTNEEIEKANKHLKDIAKLDDNKKQEKLRAFAIDHNILMPTPRNSPEFRNELFANIHMFLQTQMMLNACFSAEESGRLAKKACIWAAIAAIAACVGVVLNFFN